MASFVEYDSNNSGGDWWLKDEDWKALEAAGWRIHWATLERDYENDESDGTPKLIPPKLGICKTDQNGRWLRALATKAYRLNCSSIEEAVEEWERITGQCATDAGCPCCGNPHTFTLYVDGKVIESGPHISYSAEWD